jgi:ribosomal-protein-alanine N-acetyltransferase
VGYVFLRETREGGHIESIGVLPKHRGKGIGTALTASALAYLTERGHTRVTLVVDVRNAAALKVYARLDFDEVGRRHTLVRRQRRRNR